MNALWERYIAVLLRRAAPAGLEVHAQERHPFWTPRYDGARRVRPDIVVRTRNPRGGGKAVLVIDTKWKVPLAGIPSDDDLKQMFVYNELLGASRSVLLYPRTSTSRDVAGAYSARTHSCEQRHVGLSDGRTWSSQVIAQQLVELISELPSMTRLEGGDAIGGDARGLVRDQRAPAR